MVSRSMSVAFLILALAHFLGAVPAESQQPRSMKPAQVEHTLRTWDKEMKKIDGFLTAGEPKKAYKRASAVLGDMSERFMEGGDLVAHFLSTATVLRALAAYQLGRKDEALWHWQVAHQLFPKVADLSLTAYGDAGPYFKANPPDRFPDPAIVSNGPLEIGGEVRPPKRIRAPAPKMPFAKLGGPPVSIVARTLIGVDGRLSNPVILESEGELTLVCATFDALRDWRYEPATLHGEPVEVYFLLKVNFESR